MDIKLIYHLNLNLWLKWWDFKDNDFLAFFIVNALCLIVAILIIITFSIYAHKSKKIQKLIKAESNTIRVYIIDIKNNFVSYFNRSDLKNKKTITIDDFYQKFYASDLEKVKNWIFSICVDYTKVETYLEADILINNNKNPYFSLLKLLKYDASKGMIYLESHILKFITPVNMVKKRVGKTTKHSIGVLSNSIMKNLINNSKSIKGYTFSIRFFFLRQKYLTNEKSEQYMAITLKNSIYPFASNYKSPRQIVDNGGNEIFIFDLSIASNDEAMRLASSLSHELHKVIGVNGFNNSITFSIGVVANSSFYRSYDEIINAASESAISAHTNEQDINLFVKSNAMGKLDLSKYEEEVTKLLKPGTIRFLFRPIVNVSKKKILGYFSYVKAYNTSLTTFKEMIRYASKINKSNELFARVAKGIISKFANEVSVDKCCLFFNIDLDILSKAKEILPQIAKSKEIRLVLVFDEQEIYQNSVKVDLFNQQMESFHQLGFEIALSMRDKNLLLDPSIYSKFDFFIAGDSMTGGIKKNSKNRLSIHTLIEQLLKYKKPIIATDLEGWSTVELIIKSGINFVSSEAISSSNDMLLPIDKKKMEKLAMMVDTYRI